jgi:hypothetical protein
MMSKEALWRSGDETREAVERIAHRLDWRSHFD